MEIKNEINMTKKEECLKALEEVNKNYTTYGEEWKKEMSKLPKAVLIDIAAKIGQEKERLEELADLRLQCKCCGQNVVNPISCNKLLQPDVNSRFTIEDMRACWLDYPNERLLEILNGDYKVEDAREHLRSLIGTRWDARQNGL